MSDMEMDPLANRSSSGLDYSTLLEKLLQQNGYTSDNSKHGLKSALKDYEAVFHIGAPKWARPRLALDRRKPPSSCFIV